MVRAFIAFCFVGAAVYPALALTTKDRTFLTDIAHRGFEEIAMCKLAEKQARSTEVTSFARQITLTRSAINDEVIALGSRKSSPIPKENLGVVIGHNPKLGLSRGARVTPGPEAS